MIRGAVAVAAAAWCVAAAVWLTGGLSFRLGSVPLRSHSPLPSLVIAMAATLLVLFARRDVRRDALTWWWDVIERRPPIGAAILAIAAVAIGVSWGTFAAGGSDSYCYLNQAELFARGDVHDAEPMAADPAWPGTPAAFIPAGHSAVPSRAGALAPICPAGYSLMLAGARLAFGREAMFWVTPLMGGLLVWLTFVLGRSLDGGATGLLAALLTLTSPIVIYQVVQPMNDVPAAALWCAVLVVASRRSSSAAPQSRFSWDTGPLVTGLLSGAALTVRPNLLPLAALIGLWMAVRDGRLSFRSTLTFAAGLLPGVACVLAAQTAMYGSPLRSGYGDLATLFSAAHVAPNLVRYPRWVLEAHTPIVLLALVAPLMLAPPARRTSCWLLAFGAAVLVCYLPYVVFDDWWYQRFLLPGLAPWLVLTAVPIVRLISRLPVAWRAVAFAVAGAAVVVVFLNSAMKREAFRLQEYEHRFRAAGEYVSRLPANAAVITVHQSGSVRFYSGRTTALWEEIPPGRLADAIDYLRRNGRKPYLLLEGWEEAKFRSRFQGDALGALTWPPAVEIDRTVRIYDPDDYPKYMRGEYVPTDRINSRR